MSTELLNATDVRRNAFLSRYKPRQLMAIARRGEPGPVPVSDVLLKQFEKFKRLIEFDVTMTALSANEGRRGASFIDDCLEGYSQDFVFAERVNKDMYNFFREIRASAMLSILNVEILFIEPGEDYTVAADAWLYTRLKVDKVRNAHTPGRNLTTAVKQHEDNRDWYDFNTTLVLNGTLRHDFSLLETASQFLREMTGMWSTPPEPTVIGTLPAAEPVEEPGA